MSFLRRLLGRGEQPSSGSSDASEPGAEAAHDPSDVEEADRAADLAVLRAEDERLDEFRRRQLRYAKWAWRPPAQGGSRRADDADSREDGDPAAGEG